MKKEVIVLLNMGGPNKLEEVEVFLTNMFNDKNIIRVKSSLLRSFIAKMITFSRVEKSRDIYRQIGSKSPITGHTQELVSKLQAKVGDDVMVDFVMRYTPPFASEVIEKINRENVERIYLIPLYPQFSSTTTKSSLEDFEENYHNMGGDAILVEIKHFFQNKTFNKAVSQRIKESLGSSEAEEFDLIFSAHGLPKSIIENGDVYERHVKKHIELLRGVLEDEEMDFNEIHLAYQSKVGPMEWLKPSLEETLKEIKNKKVIIFPIAFTIDNSETVFELDIEYKEVAHKLGFKEYRVCKCPNDSDLFVDALLELYEKMR